MTHAHGRLEVPRFGCRILEGGIEVFDLMGRQTFAVLPYADERSRHRAMMLAKAVRDGLMDQERPRLKTVDEILALLEEQAEIRSPLDVETAWLLATRQYLMARVAASPTIADR